MASRLTAVTAPAARSTAAQVSGEHRKNSRPRIQQFHCTEVREQKFSLMFATNDGAPYFCAAELVDA